MGVTEIVEEIKHELKKLLIMFIMIHFLLSLLWWSRTRYQNPKRDEGVGVEHYTRVADSTQRRGTDLGLGNVQSFNNNSEKMRPPRCFFSLAGLFPQSTRSGLRGSYYRMRSALCCWRFDGRTSFNIAFCGSSVGTIDSVMGLPASGKKMSCYFPGLIRK